MAVTVGTLVVELEARVNRLERGLKKGTRGVKKFETRVNRSVKRIGRSFARLGRRVLGLGAVLATAAGAFSAVGIIRGAIDAAAAVDGFEIRLQNLIGSQRQANAAIGNLQDFAQRVAPSLKDLIEAAATLGTVALGSARKIQILTKTAANIAAVTGLTLTQSAQNLQRALSAGIGAADLFRERGVRAVVEALTGVSNLIAAPLEEVEKHMRAVFGPKGVFGEAAEAFAVTLPGAISRAGDAVFKFSSVLGDAITPSVIGILEKFIEAMGFLEDKVKDNETAISEFARKGLIAGIQALASFGQAVIGVSKAWVTFKQGMRILQLQLFKLVVFATKHADIIGLVLTGNVTGFMAGRNLKAAANLKDMEAALVVAVNETTEAAAETLKWNEAADKLAATLQLASAMATNLGEEGVASMAEANEAAKATLAGLRQQLAEARPSVDPRTLREVEAAISRQVRLLETRNRTEVEAGEPIQARILALQMEGQQLEENLAKTTAGIERIQTVLRQTRTQQTVVTKELADQEAILAAGTGKVRDVEERIAILKEESESLTRREAALVKAILRDEKDLEGIRQGTEDALVAINTEQLKLAQKESNLTAVRDSALIKVHEMLQKLKTLDEERYIIMLNQVRARQSEADGVEAQADAALESMSNVGTEIKKAAEKAAPDFSDTIGGALSSGISDALMTVVKGGAVDFSQMLADMAGSFLEKAFEDVLSGLGESLNKILDDAFSNIGGSQLGGAIGSAIGFAMMFAASALTKTEENTTRANLKSAVESVEATRGIVVGPTEIPIFKVGNAIADAFLPVEELLREGNEILRSIRDKAGGIGSVTAGVVEFNMDDALEETLNSSPALG